MDRLTAGHLRIIFAIQAACVVLYLVGSVHEMIGVKPHWMTAQIGYVLRTGVAIGLVLGTVLGWSALRKSMRKARETERKLRDASNAFMEVMAEHFMHWGLTPAESDVALFSLKGLSVNEIADLRGTSVGTVKAQTNAIYRKAGVRGRPQLLSVFIDDLIQDELPAHMASGNPAPHAPPTEPMRPHPL
ncbi:helix-turn-helix transcriptional regulator [Aquicoccus sp. G2-2]|uniref:helix-turn-helix transcriptional regulator n=1 Tax=Aquicoccus sp. G2-2 TaxID=3092120 RepID=UPI002AE034E4|nr:helix-turn-helix transcriptional regulator [Aquicoccus sp. G2-2]MEA1112480.1 helix-turn-helix transcriptional regulator [Aquicoccus sp. G2-2]